MSHFLLGSIRQVIERFPAEQVLSLFLKSFFKAHPRLGARDRRAISEAVYLYFRYREFATQKMEPLELIGHALQEQTTPNLFLKQVFLSHFDPPKTEDTFSWKAWSWRNQMEDALSEGIELKEWLESMWTQPDGFIRWRQPLQPPDLKQLNREEEILSPVAEATGGDIFSFRSGRSIERFFSKNQYVIQDRNSQRSIEFARTPSEWAAEPPLRLWDVCAGAGGKAIFWMDRRPQDALLATDVRKGILCELTTRFSLYAITGSETKVLDVQDEQAVDKHLSGRLFDVVLCDVPCTGSGTWARRPEQFAAFHPKMITQYARRQREIIQVAQKYVRQGGQLVYITCSVFREENEEAVGYLQHQSDLRLLRSRLFNGVPEKADSMFAAVFQKPLSP